MLQHVVYIVTAVFNTFNEATYFLIGDVQTAESLLLESNTCGLHFISLGVIEVHTRTDTGTN